MNNKKRVYVTIIVAIVAIVSSGLAGIGYNYFYDPFDDSAYSHNVRLHSEKDNYLESYSGNKTVTKNYASFPAYTLQQIVDRADVIAIGTITNREYIDDPYVLDGRTFDYVYTLYTVTVEKQFKGSPTQELLYSSLGGETEKIVVQAEGFVLDKGERVLLFLIETEEFEHTISYTPITLDGEYKILNNTQIARYGESITVPLEDFVDLIQEKLST